MLLDIGRCSETDLLSPYPFCRVFIIDTRGYNFRKGQERQGPHLVSLGSPCRPPRGSRAKFAYGPKLETFILSKSLLTGLTYPYDCGFVPSTKAHDGDPLDIMVIHDAATFPGIVLTCRIIGILQMARQLQFTNTKLR